MRFIFLFRRYPLYKLYTKEAEKPFPPCNPTIRSVISFSLITLLIPLAVSLSWRVIGFSLTSAAEAALTADSRILSAFFTDDSFSSSLITFTAKIRSVLVEVFTISPRLTILSTVSSWLSAKSIFSFSSLFPDTLLSLSASAMRWAVAIETKEETVQEINIKSMLPFKT
ncbi:hypothetical protein D3C72_636140 [compost metagenome]